MILGGHAFVKIADDVLCHGISKFICIVFSHYVQSLSHHQRVVLMYLESWRDPIKKNAEER